MRPRVAAEFLLRSGALGAAAFAVTAALWEVVAVQRGVNAALAALAAAGAKLTGWPAWTGAAAWGALVLGLSAASVRPVVLFWGLGMLLEAAVRWRRRPPGEEV